MEWLTHGLYDYHRYKGSSSMEPPIFSAQCTTNDYSYKIVFHCCFFMYMYEKQIKTFTLTSTRYDNVICISSIEMGHSFTNGVLLIYESQLLSISPEKTVITLILKARLTIVGTRISVARHW
jgi:hypothetical protein